jgi:hypothetical protein
LDEYLELGDVAAVVHVGKLLTVDFFRRITVDDSQRNLKIATKKSKKSTTLLLNNNCLLAGSR